MSNFARVFSGCPKDFWPGLQVFLLSSVSRYLILSKESVFEIKERSSCVVLAYSWQYIKKFRSSSMKFLLQIKRVRSSTGV